MRSVIFVPDASVTTRAGAPGGLALLDRLLKQLAALGMDAPLLVVRDGVRVPSALATMHRDAVVTVAATTPDAFAALAAAADALPPAFLFCAADHVIDPRVLRALADDGATTVVVDDDGRALPIGRASASDMREHGARVAVVARTLALHDLDAYVPELRGDAAAYAAPVTTAPERAAAWRLLLDGVQKRTLDLPGRYFDTPFENALVRRLAPTNVTPNQITALTIVIAAATAALFLHGWLRVGLVLALAVGILDGVDGKLARLKLATSRLGALEHVTDFFYENAWWLSLAAWLARVDGPRLWTAGIALVACDLADNLLYVTARARTGRMLDEVSAFDRAFRAIAGRRNVYVWVLAPGILVGHAGGAFLVASTWAALTVIVHAARVATLVTAEESRRDEGHPAFARRAAAPRATDAPLGFHLSDIDSASGVLIHEK